MADWHLAGWARENRDALLELVEEYDAVLLRGFSNAETAEDFSAFVQALRLEPFGMGCSAAPRTELAPGVFTANEAPKSISPISLLHLPSISPHPTTNPNPTQAPPQEPISPISPLYLPYISPISRQVRAWFLGQARALPPPPPRRAALLCQLHI